jgi:hypothetical protein
MVLWNHCADYGERAHHTDTDFFNVRGASGALPCIVEAAKAALKGYHTVYPPSMT